MSVSVQLPSFPTARLRSGPFVFAPSPDNFISHDDRRIIDHIGVSSTTFVSSMFDWWLLTCRTKRWSPQLCLSHCLQERLILRSANKSSIRATFDEGHISYPGLTPVFFYLLLNAGSIFADSFGSGTIPFKYQGGPYSASSNNNNDCPDYKLGCGNGGGLSQSNSQLYCNMYNTYCRNFSSRTFTTNFRDLQQYCGSQAPSRTYCSQPSPKNTQDLAAFNVSARSVRARAGSGNQIASNLGVDTLDALWYAAQITVGGLNVTVQLDTGASDFWLFTADRPIELKNTTDLVAYEVYDEDEVYGKIAFAEIDVGGLALLESQAFINVLDTEGMPDIDFTVFDGIMGMAFASGAIYSEVQQEWGTEAADALALSPMTALFAQNPLLPNYFDLQLFREPEAAYLADGAIMISSHADGFKDIESAPRLPCVDLKHWSVVMDGMLVNGQSFAFNQSRFADAPAGKIVSALDTGSSFPSLPPAAVDAIYGSIPGAQYDNSSQVWVVPCNCSTNLTFVFGGQQFPVNPLDLTYPMVATLLINGWSTDVTACINTFQYLTPDPAGSGDDFDIVLGDAFLRNVYTSFNYGGWHPTNRTDGDPFVQMVSTTNATTMWDDFYSNRTATLAQLPLPLDPALIVYYDGGSTSPDSDPTSSTTTAPSAAATATTAPDAAPANLSGAAATDGTAESDDSWGNKYRKIVLGLLAANLAVGVTLLAVVVTMCVRRKTERSAPHSRYAPVRFKEPVEE